MDGTKSKGGKKSSLKKGKNNFRFKNRKNSRGKLWKSMEVFFSSITLSVYQTVCRGAERIKNAVRKKLYSHRCTSHIDCNQKNRYDEFYKGKTVSTSKKVILEKLPVVCIPSRSSREAENVSINTPFGILLKHFTLPFHHDYRYFFDVTTPQIVENKIVSNLQPSYIPSKNPIVLLPLQHNNLENKLVWSKEALRLLDLGYGRELLALLEKNNEIDLLNYPDDNGQHIIYRCANSYPRHYGTYAIILESSAFKTNINMLRHFIERRNSKEAFKIIVEEAKRKIDNDQNIFRLSFEDKLYVFKDIFYATVNTGKFPRQKELEVFFEAMVKSCPDANERSTLLEIIIDHHRPHSNSGYSQIMNTPFFFGFFSEFFPKTAMISVGAYQKITDGSPLKAVTIEKSGLVKLSRLEKIIKLERALASIENEDKDSLTKAIKEKTLLLRDELKKAKKEWTKEEWVELIKRLQAEEDWINDNCYNVYHDEEHCTRRAAWDELTGVISDACAFDKLEEIIKLEKVIASIQDEDSLLNAIKEKTLLLRDELKKAKEEWTKEEWDELTKRIQKKEKEIMFNYYQRYDEEELAAWDELKKIISDMDRPDQWHETHSDSLSSKKIEIEMNFPYKELDDRESSGRAEKLISIMSAIKCERMETESTSRFSSVQIGTYDNAIPVSVPYDDSIWGC